MKRLNGIAGVCIIIAALAGAAAAERPPERKETADFILTGKVNRIYTRREGRLTEYVVRIIIDQVHKGEGVKPGEAFYISVFQKSAPLLPVAEARGHSDVPKEGQVIKAYIHDRAGRHEGNYKDWFEVVAQKPQEEK